MRDKSVFVLYFNRGETEEEEAAEKETLIRGQK